MVNKDLFKDFATSVEVLREDILNIEYPPNLQKTSPLFPIGQAANILGVPRTHLQKLIRENSVEFSLNDKGNRCFNLEELYKVREYLQATATKKNYLKRRPPQVKKPFVIAVTNLKGGSSKTTTSIMLGQGLAIEGYRVLLIDSDPQGSLTSLKGYLPFEQNTTQSNANFVNPEETLLALYENDAPLEPLKTYWKNLDLIPSNIRLFDTEFLLPARQMSDEDFQFFNLLNTEIEDSLITEDYDIIVIDCPPSFSYMTINALYAADALIVPVPPNHLDILATGAFFDQLHLVMEQIESAFGVEKKFDFVAGLKTRMDSEADSLKNGERISEIFGRHMLNNDIVVSKAIKAATDKNMTLFELGVNSNIVDRRTYNRALESFNSVNKEVEQKIIEAWNQKVQSELDLEDA